MYNTSSSFSHSPPLLPRGPVQRRLDRSPVELVHPLFRPRLEHIREHIRAWTELNLRDYSLNEDRTSSLSTEENQIEPHWFLTTG